MGRAFNLLLSTRDPFADDPAGESAGRFGMWLFLASLAMLFGATVVGYVVLKVQLHLRGTWPSDLPSLPWPLVLSTGLLAVSSWTFERARIAARRPDARPGDADTRGSALRTWLGRTTGLGLAFLVLQAWCWWVWLTGVSDRWADSLDHRWALAGFYVLTGIHALHVIGGIVPLVIIHLLCRGGHFDHGRTDAVHLTGLYWHFLGAVWVILYGLLLVTI